MTKPTLTFSENFIEESTNALENSRYTDVKIILSDEPMKPEYHLHKVILAATSSFFRELFYHEPKPVYEIGAMSKRSFEDVLGYMYRQTITLTYENFESIRETALYLGCEEIMERMNNKYLWLSHGMVQIKGRRIVWIGDEEPLQEGSPPREEWDLEEDTN